MVMNVTPTTPYTNSPPVARRPHDIPTTTLFSIATARPFLLGPLWGTAGLGTVGEVMGMVRGFVTLREPTCAVRTSAEAGATEARRWMIEVLRGRVTDKGVLNCMVITGELAVARRPRWISLSSSG